MSFLSIVTALGGLCLGFGILHLAVARLGHAHRHLGFGAVAVLAAIGAWMHVQGYATTDVGRYTVVMKWWIVELRSHVSSPGGLSPLHYRREFSGGDTEASAASRRAYPDPTGVDTVPARVPPVSRGEA